MRYTPGDGSNIEDRRGGGGGGGGFRIGGGAAPVGVGGLLLLLVLSWATGTNFLQLLDTGGGDTAVSDGPSPPANQSPAEQRMVGFVDAGTVRRSHPLGRQHRSGRRPQPTRPRSVRAKVGNAPSRANQWTMTLQTGSATAKAGQGPRSSADAPRSRRKPGQDRKSTRLTPVTATSRMPSSA